MVDQHVALAQHSEQVGRLVAGVGQPRRRHGRPRLLVEVGAVEVVDAPQARRGRAARRSRRGRSGPRSSSRTSISRMSSEMRLRRPRGAPRARSGGGAAPSRPRPAGRPPRPLRAPGRRCVSPGTRSARRSPCRGTTWPSWAAMICSRATNRSPSGMTTNRGSSGGTFTLATRSTPADRVAHPDDEVERQVRDVGEGMARVHRQRREHREDLALEHLHQVPAIVVVERRPVRQPHARLGQCGHDPVEEDAALAVAPARHPAPMARAPRSAAARRRTGSAGRRRPGPSARPPGPGRTRRGPRRRSRGICTRSSSGTRSSPASSSSRAPNSSHDSSRLEKRSGPSAVTASSVPTGERAVATSPGGGPAVAAAVAPGADSEACIERPG